jgi:hypothetical protein
LGRVRWRASLAGVVCLAVCALGGIWWRDQFFTAYLFSYLFVLGIALGSLAIVMLHHMVGGDWGRAVRPAAEAAAITLPLLLVLFLPILLGLKVLYPWANHHLVEADRILRHQAGYLNVGFVIARWLVCFAVWIGLAWAMWRISVRLERDPGPDYARGVRKLCAAGLVLLILTISLASFDWIMSREAHWFSTIIGLLTSVSFALSAVVFLVALLWILSRSRPMSDLLSPAILNDLGNLLMTLVILWAYMSFAQFLIIWMGNARGEATWYIRRGLGNEPNALRLVGLLLVVAHFFAPFLLLLMRDIKQRLDYLAAVALGLLVLRLIDMYWMAVPGTLARQWGLSLSWMDFLLPIGVGGIWLSAFITMLHRRPIVARATAHEMQLDAQPLPPPTTTTTAAGAAHGPHGGTHAPGTE